LHAKISLEVQARMVVNYTEKTAVNFILAKLQIQRPHSQRAAAVCKFTNFNKVGFVIAIDSICIQCKTPTPILGILSLFAWLNFPRK